MEKKKSKSSKKFTVLLIFFLFAGLSLLLYPTISDWWNSMHQSRAIANYMEDVVELDDETYDLIWQQARQYNAALPRDNSRFTPTEEQLQDYAEVLNVSGNGIMGYVEIPKIDVMLPVYHGTDEAVLQVAVGHIVGSSVPVGGSGSHCVVSGHRGLPSAKLFTDLDQMEVGDTFLLHVLDEVLTYEVDQIVVVLPEDVSELAIQEGEDLCTLVTCTPYGVNSHRMLVRGHRVETEETTQDTPIRIMADAVRVDPTMVALIIGGFLLAIILLFVLVNPFKRKRR